MLFSRTHRLSASSARATFSTFSEGSAEGTGGCSDPEAGAAAVVGAGAGAAVSDSAMMGSAKSSS